MWWQKIFESFWLVENFTSKISSATDHLLLPAYQNINSIKFENMLIKPQEYVRTSLSRIFQENHIFARRNCSVWDRAKIHFLICLFKAKKSLIIKKVYVVFISVCGRKPSSKIIETKVFLYRLLHDSSMDVFSNFCWT